MDGAIEAVTDAIVAKGIWDNTIVRLPLRSFNSGHNRGSTVYPEKIWSV